MSTSLSSAEIQGESPELPQPVRSSTLAAQVFDILKDQIFAGKLPPGTALREAQFGRALGVSQATVREALVLLQQIGLVVRAPNKGTAVTKLTNSELCHRLKVRIVLEELACAESAQRMTEQDFTELERLAGNIASAVPRGDSIERSQADVRFHRFIWEKSRNPILAQTLEQLTASLFAFLSVKQKMAAADYGVDYQKHEGIASALRSRDPERARQAIRMHIENSYGGILNQTEGPEE
jgi:DNA-binding GntR family transcriptional regulator